MTVLKVKSEKLFLCEDFMSVYMELKDMTLDSSVLIPATSVMSVSMGTVTGLGATEEEGYDGRSRTSSNNSGTSNDR